MTPKILLLISLPLIIAGVFFYTTNQDSGTGISENAIVFTQVNVISMTNENILENQTVIISGDRIKSIQPYSQLNVPESATHIDGTGKYLIPGLAEMHGHVPPTDPPANAPSYMNMDYVEHTLFLYTAAGITTVRGMLGYDNQLELKEKVSSGELIGPNLYLAGPSFNGNSIHSPQEAIDKVRVQKEEGWDLLKVHPGLTLDEYDAMANTANSVKIPFGGHVPTDVGIIHAIEMGQLTLDHLDGYIAYLDTFEDAELDQKMDEIIQLTLDHDVWVVPTQALWETIIGAADYDKMKAYDELKYIPSRLLSSYNSFVKNTIDNNPNFDKAKALKQAALRQRLLSKMNKAGVNILMGTDAPQLYSVPGFSIYRELALMAEAGMTPYEILKTGTSNVGRYFSDKDNFGVLKAGYRADLILVNQNPLTDIENIQDHSGVMVSGKWLSRSTIDTKLKMIASYYSN